MNEQELLRKLREAFRQEATERLTTIATSLLQLEKEGVEGVSSSLLEGIFRDAHSLKGAARAVTLREMESVCQTLEGVFAAIKGGGLAVTAELFDRLHRAVAFLEKLLAHDLNQPLPAAARRELLALTNELEQLSRPAKAALPEQVAAVAVPAVMQPSPQATVFPSPALEKEQRPVAPHVAQQTAFPEQLPAASLPVTAAVQPAVEPEGPAAGEITIRVGAERLDQLLVKAEELIGLKQVYQQQVQSLRQLLPLLGSPKSLQGLLKSMDQGQRLAQRMVDELLHTAKQLTLVESALLLDPLPRMVREIAREQGKEVAWQASGREIEVDRRILQAMRDPVLHLLRNALDHGLESPEERQRQGKPRCGVLAVEVRQDESSRVEIVVRDDGRGLSVERIRTLAVQKGLLSSEQAASCSEAEVLELIFHSGFSTAERVTTLSGRGLGMAIVRQGVEKLGGSLQLHNRPGEGVTFRMGLPVSLATFRGVLIACREQWFILPTLQVEAVQRVKRQALRTVEGCVTLLHEGVPVAIVELADLLHLPVVNRQERNDEWLVVILGRGTQRLAFRIQEVLKEQEVLVKGLGKLLRKVPLLAGATILGSGRIVPILHVQELLLAASRHALVTRQVAENEEESAKRILVVEDSLTSRMLLKNILEAAGYAVHCAVDGLDGWQQLQEEGCDLVVSDVEMPRCDGFALTEKIRADQRFGRLPVVLVTSLSSQEHRQRGVTVGASAYLVKSDFDQQDLLTTIGRLV
ncbi:MAG: response regulator [Magnetococcales bacterium]|nr:response regulator [Magnetococcales bacterium]